VLHKGYTDEEIVGLADQDNENDEYHRPVPLVDVWMDYKRLADMGWTQQRIADAKGGARSTVASRLRWAEWPTVLRNCFVESDFLREGHATEIERLSNFDFLKVVPTSGACGKGREGNVCGCGCPSKIHLFDWGKVAPTGKGREGNVCGFEQNCSNPRNVWRLRCVWRRLGREGNAFVFVWRLAPGPLLRCRLAPVGREGNAFVFVWRLGPGPLLCCVWRLWEGKATPLPGSFFRPPPDNLFT
jgi:hypothetical protein